MRERLLRAGATLFLEKGFGGASVRDICQAAGASSRMIHHYFGSKRGLYDEIIAGFSEKFLDVPMRIVAATPETQVEFALRFEIFFAETLEAIIENREIYELVDRAKEILPAYQVYHQRLGEFLDAATARGLFRAGVDTAMLTGTILDRTGRQVVYADGLDELIGVSVLSDDDYKRRWVKANVDMILNGLLAPDEPGR